MKPVPIASDAKQFVTSNAQMLPSERAVFPELHRKTLVTVNGGVKVGHGRLVRGRPE